MSGLLIQPISREYVLLAQWIRCHACTTSLIRMIATAEVTRSRRALLACCAAVLATCVLPAWSASQFSATKASVANRGAATGQLSAGACRLGRTAPDEIFAMFRGGHLCLGYAAARPLHGPGAPTRRATEKAGAFQCSCNSLNWPAGFVRCKVPWRHLLPGLDGYLQKRPRIRDGVRRAPQP